jgi:hypothetical protein
MINKFFENDLPQLLAKKLDYIISVETNEIPSIDIKGKENGNLVYTYLYPEGIEARDKDFKEWNKILSQVIEEFYILDSETKDHIYTITKRETKKGEVFTMNRSNSEGWVEECRGEEMFSMTNHGDGVKFKNKISNLDYGQMEALRILLEFENKTYTCPLNKVKYLFVNESDLTEI